MKNMLWLCMSLLSFNTVGAMNCACSIEKSQPADLFSHLEVEKTQCEAFKDELYDVTHYNTPYNRWLLPKDDFCYTQEEQDFLYKSLLSLSHPWYAMVQKTEACSKAGKEGSPWLKSVNVQRVLSHIVVEKIIKEFNLKHLKLPTTYVLLTPEVNSPDEITGDTTVKLVQEHIPPTQGEEITQDQARELCILMFFFNLDVGFGNLHVHNGIVYLIDAEDKNEPASLGLPKLDRYSLSDEAENFINGAIKLLNTYEEETQKEHPLYRVCKAGSLAYVKYLCTNEGVYVAYPFCVNYKVEGVTSILEAARSGHWQVVQFLLETYPCKQHPEFKLDVLSTLPKDQTLMQLALNSNQLEVVRLLKEKYLVSQ